MEYRPPQLGGETLSRQPTTTTTAEGREGRREEKTSKQSPGSI